MNASDLKPKGRRRAFAVAGALVAVTAGCDPMTVPPPTPAVLPPGTVVVFIGPGQDDDVSVDGWTVAERDLPAYMAHRHATAVVIRGDRGTRYDRALRVEAELQTIGIQNITITPAGQ